MIHWCYMAGDTSTLALTYIWRDLIWGILKFPVWWYTRGLLLVGRWVLRAWAQANRTLGFSVWVRNLFVPMYGETDWTGRLISFFVRAFMVCARGIGVLAWGLGTGVLFVAYLIAPPLSVVGVLYHGFGLVIV